MLSLQSVIETEGLSKWLHCYLFIIYYKKMHSHSWNLIYDHMNPYLWGKGGKTCLHISISIPLYA